MDDAPAHESAFRFEPVRLTLPRGAVATFEGGAAQPHTLTHDAPQGQRLFHVTVDAGESKAFQAPPLAGEYAFLCVYHPGMRGTLVVS